MRDTITQLEAELVRLTEALRPGGSQEQCESLRSRIANVRAAIEHRERNIAFVRDEFMDDE
jgi:predicted secreted Zn-dependent protease